MLLDANGNEISNSKEFRSAIVLVRPRKALEYAAVPLLQTIVNYYEKEFRNVHLASGFDNSIDAEFVVVKDSTPEQEPILFQALLEAHFQIADLLIGQGEGKAPLSAVRDGTMDKKVLETIGRVTGHSADELEEELKSRRSFVQKKIEKGVN